MATDRIAPQILFTRLAMAELPIHGVPHGVSTETPDSYVLLLTTSAPSGTVSGCVEHASVFSVNFFFFFFDGKLC